VSEVLRHVYGIIAADAPAPEGLVGRADAPVRRIADDELAVLVSDIAGDAPVRRADLLAHAHLLESLAATTTVVPVRFGVLVPDDDTVRREFLGQQRRHLLGLLAAFEGYVQLTVQATYDEERALREVLDRDPELAELRTAIAGSNDPDAQIRLGEAVAQALTALREEACDLVVGRLQGHAHAVTLNEARGAYDVASVSLLVRRDARDRLDAEVGRLDRELHGRISLRYVGPQPPYAFLDHVVLDEEAASWA
jgi:hypothetical protein